MTMQERARAKREESRTGDGECIIGKNIYMVKTDFL